MAPKTRLVLAALLAAALATATHAGRKEDQALEAARAGEHGRAAALWLEMAEKGDPSAQFRFGTLVMQGRGVTKDETEGVRWFRRAAEAGLPQAETQLALVYLSGRGNPEDDPNAERYMRATAETAPGRSKYELGLLYMKGRVVPQNNEEARRWFDLAGESWGRGGARDMVIRMRDEGYLHTAAEIGYAEAQLFLGDLYSSGDGVPKSREEAAKWHYLAANQGHTEAQMTLAWSFGRGIGVTKDPVESARWFRKAAEAGHVQGQYQLGLMLRDGLGVKKDKIESHMWFNLASAQGHDMARSARDELVKQMTRDQKAEAEERAVTWWRDRMVEAEAGSGE